jgi:hypothetical protein
MSWATKPSQTDTPLLCRMGIHSLGDWKTNVEPDLFVEVTLVVKRRWCTRCKAMNYKELERHG